MKWLFDKTKAIHSLYCLWHYVPVKHEGVQCAFTVKL